MQVIGHRGARGLFPENTLQGFQAAAALGVIAFELDVGMTADGVVVVCHDPALDPDITRDAAGQFLSPPGPLLHTLSAAELGRYDVGRIRPQSRTSRRFPQQRPHDGARVPTLAAVLAALPDATFVIEVKTDPTQPRMTATPITLADAVLAVVDTAAAADRVVIESFDWRVPRHIRRIRPEIRLAWLTLSDPLHDRALWWDDANFSAPDHTCQTPPRSMPVPARIAVEAGSSIQPIWAPEHTGLTRTLVQQAHALGLLVMPWTVNRPPDIDRLIRWGIDGLISDRPDLVLHASRR